MSYSLIQQLNPQYAHIKFNSAFQGKTVTWDTHFFTIEGYNAHINCKNLNQKQFIDIEKIEPDSINLTIALKIEEITIPNIHKMMIMIKQYKNLSFGRHEYG